MPDEPFTPWLGAEGLWRRTWPAPQAELFVIQRIDLRPEEEPLDELTAGSLLNRWLQEPFARHMLLDLCGTLTGGGWQEHRLREAFRRGELVVLRMRRPVLAASDLDEPASPPRAPAPPPRRTTKTWVEVRLVDMEDRPAGNKRYRIELPGGQVEEGYLDESGRVRFNGIDPGTCIVSFPDLDRDAWDWA